MDILRPGELSHSRIGRFSIRPGPQARAQRKWKTLLPWKVWAELLPEGTRSLRHALSLELPSAENEHYWGQFVSMLGRGGVLLRMIRLNERHRVSPGETATQRNARLKRWLPAGWKGDGHQLRLRWTKPTRFACPARSQTIAPRDVPLVVSPTPFLALIEYVADGGVARWLEDGQIIIVLPVYDSATGESSEPRKR